MNWKFWKMKIGIIRPVVRAIILDYEKNPNNWDFRSTSIMVNDHRKVHVYLALKEIDFWCREGKTELKLNHFEIKVLQDLIDSRTEKLDKQQKLVREYFPDYEKLETIKEILK